LLSSGIVDRVKDLRKGTFVRSLKLNRKQKLRNEKKIEIVFPK
jgi:hypothetical protein